MKLWNIHEGGNSVTTTTTTTGKNKNSSNSNNNAGVHSIGKSGLSKKSMTTLPGHEDEVYCVDWAPDGRCVASGSKDRTIKLWHH